MTEKVAGIAKRKTSLSPFKVCYGLISVLIPPPSNLTLPPLD